MSGGDRWFLVHSRPGRETLASQHLQRQAFEVFLPRIMKSVRHARRLEIRLAPYFPGYLFVRLDPGRDRWRSVNGTLGVAYLAPPGGAPQPVPEGIVEALLASADRNGLNSGQHLSHGQSVRMMAGPFAEQIGTIDRLDGNGRVRVLLEIMGGIVPVDAARSYLVAAR